jgi:GNAT superfamily N-acetyltransferase
MPPKITIAKNITADQVNQLDQLWNESYPKSLNNRFNMLLEDIKEYYHHILLNDTNEIIGWAVAFLREEEIWFSILVDSTHQNKGYGKMLINSLKQNYTKLNGWVIDHNNDLKVNGQYYNTPIQFYKKNGFEIIAEKRIETDIISAVKICWIR